jgi:phospholysine phosphohistidine inorganic pyrophosphate phosphatase
VRGHPGRRLAYPAMRAILFDLDGTLYEDGVALPGASETVAGLRRRGVQVGFVTNATSRSRRLLVERLAECGIPAREDDLVTALRAGAVYLAEKGCRRVHALVPQAAREDLAGFDLEAASPEAVVVGDLDDRWDFAILNTAFHHLMHGAELVALSRDRYWQRPDGGGLVLDCGPFVAALEYASGQKAEVCGKPSRDFYHAALAMLGPWALERPGEVLMVGDDVWGDVAGAQEAGLKACLVRTGKFRAEVFAKSGVTPDLVVDGVGDLVAAL